jgi:copper(I)-binding protein
MQPAVNGNAVTVKNIALRDVRIVAVQTGDKLEPGKSVDLKFVAVNQSPDVSDQLVGITSDIGTVTVSGNTTIPPLGSLVVGAPDGPEASALSAQQGVVKGQASVALTKPITNGLNYDFTFKFAKAGEASVVVPVAAPENAPRAEAPVLGNGEGEHH